MALYNGLSDSEATEYSPNILHFTNEGKPYLLTSSKKPVKGELIAVEYGTDIMEAEEVLMKDIVDDLAEKLSLSRGCHIPGRKNVQSPVSD